MLGLSTVVGSVGATLSVILATTVTTAIEQEMAIGMGLQDHFSLSKSVMEGLAAGIGYFNLPAGMPAAFGSAMQALSKIAIEEQLAEFAAEGKKIDMREVISNIISGAIMFGVTPRMPLTAITEAEAAGRIALRDVESSLVSNIVEDALMHKPFDFESVAEQALGVTIADIGTNIVKSEIQIAKANQQTQASAQKSYTEAQQNSVNSKNPGGNRFSMFGNSNSSDQQSSNNAPRKINWLTDSADKILGDDSFDGLSPDPGNNDFSILNETPEQAGLSIIEKIGEKARGLYPEYSEMYEESWGKASQAYEELHQLEQESRLTMEQGLQWMRTESAAAENINLSAKYGFYSSTAKYLGYGVRVTTGLEFVSAFDAVYEADADKKFQVGVGKFGELGSSWVGRSAGASLAAQLVVAGAELELVPGLGTVVGSSLIFAGGVVGGLTGFGLFKIAEPHVEPVLEKQFNNLKINYNNNW